MTLEQTVEIPPNRRLVFDLPSEMPVGKARVELTITPEKTESAVSSESAFGCLHWFADPARIPGEKEAWAQAVLDKHAKD